MARQATQLVMTYDEAGNASFKSEVVTNQRDIGSSKVFTIGEAINRFQFDDSPATQNTTVDDPLSTQLNAIKKYIMGDSSDDGETISTDYTKEFKQFSIRDSIVDDISKGLGESEGKKYNKFSTIADATGTFRSVNKNLGLASSLGFNVPTADPITNLFTLGLNKYSEYQRQNILEEYFETDYYQDKMTGMQTEYETYGDYDAYTDYSAGPTYTREDLKPGTVFDAEDEGGGDVPGIMSKDQGAVTADYYGGSDDSGSDSGSYSQSEVDAGVQSAEDDR
tara:strand:- start:347 stop:1183 length:837 start_codon:yes stop_codon:yes gene_type:complete